MTKKKMQLKSFAIVIAALLSSCLHISAQKKQMWAKSLLNQQAPELNLEYWISEVPDIKDKFILLDFWATWCAPCIKGIPKMNAFSEEFDKDLLVIGISKEDEHKVRQMSKPQILYYSAIDAGGRLNEEFQISGIPHAVLIDPDGIVKWEGFPNLRGHALTSKVIKKIIEDY